MFLYHYYEKALGPFRSLSSLPKKEAEGVLSYIRKIRPHTMAAARDEEYMERRLAYEKTAYDLFVSRGGKPERTSPHYMVAETCPWLASWYQEGEFDLKTLSFTYGDMHPTFSPRVNDGKEYRKKIYFYTEILELIQKYGLPQQWNAEGLYGPERYIEAQVWSDRSVSRYLKDFKSGL